MKDHLHHKNSLVKNIFAMGILGLTLYLGQFNTVAAMPVEGPAASQTPTLSPPQKTVAAPVDWRTSTPTSIPTPKPTNTPWPTSTQAARADERDYTERTADTCVDSGGVYILEKHGEVVTGFCAVGILPSGCRVLPASHVRDVIYCN